MDGASKFVRGDAIAGLLITGINMFGGIIIGYARHGMEIGEAADVFVRLSVGDGLVSQIPALIVSLAAGLLVSRGGQLGSTDEAVIDQLGGYPRALFAASGLLFLLAVMPGLPFFPFRDTGRWDGVREAGSSLVSATMLARAEAQEVHRSEQEEKDKEKDSVKSILKTAEIELVLGKQVATKLLGSHEELAFRVSKMRKKFATQYGFVVPEIKVTDDICHQGQELPDPDSRHHGGSQ
jgi:flagellar biosynthesis protein FlhA